MPVHKKEAITIIHETLNQELYLHTKLNVLIANDMKIDISSALILLLDVYCRKGCKAVGSK